jgi:hypothetical protein
MFLIWRVTIAVGPGNVIFPQPVEKLLAEFTREYKSFIARAFPGTRNISNKRNMD